MANKQQRKDAAFAHMADTQSRLRENTEQSLRELEIYDEPKLRRIVALPAFPTDTRIEVEARDSVGGVMAAPAGKKIALLDFASYRNPGGGFSNGALAQEEAICSESNLYDILSKMEGEYYAPNRSRQNRSLYTSRSMYVPRVVFERDGVSRESDVIVMAAPNWKAARNHGVGEDECREAMRSRIDAVMSIAADNGVGHLVLGAFGCGVFGNAPYDVAKMFKEWLDAHPKVFESVVFAIPKGANLDAFVEILEGEPR